MFLCRKNLLYSTEVLLDIYREYVKQIQVINYEYIVKISRGIAELVYEVKPFGFLEVFYVSQFVPFARGCTCFYDFNSKIFKSLQNCLHRVTYIKSLYIATMLHLTA